jgi:transposase
MLYLATDQHSKQLTTNLRDEEGQILLRRQVSTEWEKVRRFFDDVRSRSQDHGGFVTILEVCGFNDWLLKMLQEYGCREIVLIQPKEKSRKKTDRRDANQLGELLWVNRHRLAGQERVQGIRRIRILDEREQENRRLTMTRLRTTRQLTRTINGIKQILRRHNLEHDQPTKGIQTQAARKWLRGLELSELDRMAMNILLDQWKQWDSQLESLDEAIGRRVAECPNALLLGSLTGRAGFSALAIACRIGPINDFPRPRSLANYFGLTPSCNNTGDNTQRLGSISKEGSPVVRYILGQLVLHVLKRDFAMRKWYKRIRQRRGSKIARVAVMRRLTVIIWHMLTRKETYMTGRFTRDPVTK